MIKFCVKFRIYIKKMSNGVEIPPLRGINDFILESARFQLPEFNDLEKWGNRVLRNLMYYQTNYLMIAVCFFIVMFIFHPLKMSLAIFAVLALVYLKFNYLQKNSQTKIKNAKDSYIFVISIGIALLLLYLMEAVIVTLLTFLVPFCGKFNIFNIHRYYAVL